MEGFFGSMKWCVMPATFFMKHIN